VNLTIAVDRHVLKRARLRALAEDTSVNAVLVDCLEAYAGGILRNREAVRRLVRLAETGESGRAAAAWMRDELYER